MDEKEGGKGPYIFLLRVHQFGNNMHETVDIKGLIIFDDT